MPNICKACGKENRDEAKFCSGCGSPLKKKKERSLRQKEKDLGEARLSGNTTRQYQLALLA